MLNVYQIQIINFLLVMDSAKGGGCVFGPKTLILALFWQFIAEDLLTFH